MSEVMTAPFGAQLRTARVEAGMSLADAMVWLRSEMPSAYHVSIDKLRRLETGEIPVEKIDPVLAGALARAYGVPLRALSMELENRCEHAITYARQGLCVGIDGVPVAENLLNPRSSLWPAGDGDGDGYAAGDSNPEPSD